MFHLTFLCPYLFCQFHTKQVGNFEIRLHCWLAGIGTPFLYDSRRTPQLLHQPVIGSFLLCKDYFDTINIFINNGFLLFLVQSYKYSLKEHTKRSKNSLIL